MSNIHMELTIKGEELEAKIRKGRGDLPLEITRVVSASSYSPDPLSLGFLSELDIRQTAIITGQERVGTRAVIEVQLTNQGNRTAGEPALTAGYELFQLGMGAIDPDEGEILYRISQFERSAWVPPATEIGWTINPSWNFVVGRATKVIVQIDPSGMATIGQLNDHIIKSVRSEAGVHDFRYHDGALSVFDGDSWQQVSFDTDAVLPSTFITTLPITGDDFFSVWDLFNNMGGISPALGDWNFTNATLSKIANRVVVSIDNGSVSVYGTSEFADRQWTAAPYKEGVWILTAAEPHASLVLIRR